jgi:hypothetical protein
MLRIGFLTLTRIYTVSHTYSFGPPVAFLDWPTVEGLEAFAEKKVEYGEMMEDHVTDLQVVIWEQRIIVDGLRRAAELAEEHRLQEFQRDLERMVQQRPKWRRGQSESVHSLFRGSLRLDLRS